MLRVFEVMVMNKMDDIHSAAELIQVTFVKRNNHICQKPAPTIVQNLSIRV